MIDPTLCVGTFQIWHTEQEGEQSHERLFWLQDEVLISNDIERINSVGDTILLNGLEIAPHDLRLSLDKPGPPLGILCVDIKVGLPAMRHGVAESGVGREDIEWISDALEDPV